MTDEEREQLAQNFLIELTVQIEELEKTTGLSIQGVRLSRDANNSWARNLDWKST
jgi:hypothetical protein